MDKKLIAKIAAVLVPILLLIGGALLGTDLKKDVCGCETPAATLVQ